jgi:hypothetical protein
MDLRQPVAEMTKERERDTRRLYRILPDRDGVQIFARKWKSCGGAKGVGDALLHDQKNGALVFPGGNSVLRIVC